MACTQIRKAWPSLACHLSSSGRVLLWLKSPHGPLEDLLTVCSEHEHKKSSFCASTSKKVQPSPTEYMKLQHVLGSFYLKHKASSTTCPGKGKVSVTWKSFPECCRIGGRSRHHRTLCKKSSTDLIQILRHRLESFELFLKNPLIKHFFIAKEGF